MIGITMLWISNLSNSHGNVIQPKYGDNIDSDFAIQNIGSVCKTHIYIASQSLFTKYDRKNRK